MRQAISIGRRIEEYGLYWLKEVVARDDFAGRARVTTALDTPTVAGEYVFGIVPFRHMFEARSVDIATLDVMRTGGISIEVLARPGLGLEFDEKVCAQYEA